MNKIYFIAFILFAMFVATQAVASVPAFTADLFITKDPNMNVGSGVTVNKIYYDFTGKKMRLDYPELKQTNGKKGLSEIYDYGLRVVFQLCKECSQYRQNLPQPVYFYQSTDTIINGNTITHDKLGTCQAYKKADANAAGQIATVWVNSAGLPCQAQRTDTTILKFSNVVAGTPDKTKFVIPTSAKCPPQPTCAAPIDLVLVFDQSGSIKPPEWKQLLAFGNAIIDGFEIGRTKTQIGLVFFSGVDYQNHQNPASCCGLSAPVLPLSFSKPTIQKFLNNHRQTGGHTCINCGINSATTYEPNPNRAVQVPKVMIIVTDGFNNRMVNFFGIDISNAKNLGWKMFSVGVRQADRAELAAIASTPTKEHMFFVEDFSILKSIQQNIVENVCAQFPGLTPCGPLCKGKCTCGGQCLCPDTCSTGDNKCAKGECVINEAGSGCRLVNKLCPQGATAGNKCKSVVCNPTNGLCETKDKVCTAADKCATATCDPKLGCIYKDKCDAKIKIAGTALTSQCKKRACDEQGACIASSVNCGSTDKCVAAKCDPKLGCVKAPINCEDGNKCTLKKCDPKVGCVVASTIECPPKGFFQSPEYLNNKAKYACTTFRCDPKVGCVTTPKICDDKNLCTKDKCDPATNKCVVEDVTCKFDQTNKCITSKCDPNLGCQQITKACDDGNPCTKDSCDPATGLCKNDPIICPQSTNACQKSVCDPKAGKCILTPTVICAQPTDKCQTSKCDPATQTCQVTTRGCAAPDACQIGACDSVLGCIYTTKKCTGNDPCKEYKCDPVKGCVEATIAGCKEKPCVPTCDTSDPCNPQSCIKGKCVPVPVTCDIPNKCAKTFTPTVVDGKCSCIPGERKTCPKAPESDCGESVCDPATGNCITKADRVCNNDDPCVTPKCVVEAGQKKCTFTGTKCAGDSPCSRQKCTNVNGKPQCVPDPDNGVKCDDKSECSTGKCDPKTGQCVYTEKKCDTATDLCVARKCDGETGKCVDAATITCPVNDKLGCGKGGKCITLDEKPVCTFEPLCPRNESACFFANCTNGNCKSFSTNCDDGDPCTKEDKCVSLGYDPSGKPLTKCEYTPFECTPSTDPCKINKCVKQPDGTAKCVETPVVCDDGNNCTTGACVAGKCQFTEVNCGEEDICSFFLCDPANGCIKKSRCNDSDPCTKDVCDAKSGACTFTPLNCTSDDLCKVGKCDEAQGCITIPYDCSQNATFNATIDRCHFGVCDSTKGCILNVVPNTLSECGTCLGPDDQDTCRAANVSAPPVAAIAGSVIGAAIVVGAVAIGLGICLAKRAADSYTPGGDDAIVGANTNPLYAQGADQGVNPFHNEVGSNDDYVQLTN